MPHSSALVLFDIDGTLVRRAGPHHRQALVDAVREVSDLETTTEHIPVHGMLDPDIVTRMMRDAGASGRLIRQSMPAIIKRAQAIYLRTCPDLRKKTCPGVRRLLGMLDRRAIPLGLVSGNLSRIGWKKLERAGLRDYFRFGIFAEMGADRAALVALAIRRAPNGARISLVGDAPSDILAAKANGIRSIAVHTGISTPQELRAHSPDVLLEDLRSLRLEMLL
jgi:phosphoglycolate phosphatase